MLQREAFDSSMPQTIARDDEADWTGSSLRKRSVALLSHRFLRYGLVSLLSTMAGAVLLTLFVRSGMSVLWSNVWAVALPTTPAYLLHRVITWRDRTGVDLKRSLGMYWLFAIVGAAASTCAVWTLGLITSWPPALVATQLLTYGALWVARYLVLDRFAFTETDAYAAAGAPTSNATIGDVPRPGRGVPDLDAPTVAAFLPAYNEEHNLATTVYELQATLTACAREWTVIVVDDGSVDRTSEVAGDLARETDGVWSIHHLENRGYGAALRTGLDAALATGHEWVFFTDADGQFETSQLTGFLRTAKRHTADLVVGYRDQRADPWHRRLNGKLWTWLSCALMGIRFRDVDCAFKLFRRDVIAGQTLLGEAASISPELLAKASVRSSRVIELSVWHFPRESGTQTGAKLSVIGRSLLDLWRLSALRSS